MDEQLDLYIKSIPTPKEDETVICYVKCNKDGHPKVDFGAVAQIHCIVDNAFPDNKVITIPEIYNLESYNMDALWYIKNTIDNVLKERGTL